GIGIDVFAEFLPEFEFAEITRTDKSARCTRDEDAVFHQLATGETVSRLHGVERPQGCALAAAADAKEDHLRLFLAELLPPGGEHRKCSGPVFGDGGAVVQHLQ